MRLFSQFQIKLFHAGSYPPGHPGLQRSIRIKPRKTPNPKPYFPTASNKYWLQVGSKRQHDCGNHGFKNKRYHATNNQTKNNPTRLKIPEKNRRAFISNQAWVMPHAWAMPHAWPLPPVDQQPAWPISEGFPSARLMREFPLASKSEQNLSR